MTKEIELTQGQFAIVDDEDFGWLSQWKWRAHWDKNAKTYYACRNHTVDGKYIHLSMARLIMDTPNGLLTDHINHNTLDNRKENLRNVTISQNSINRKPSNRNKIGFRGVSRNGDKYRARITLNKTCIDLGNYNNPEEASVAYENASQKLHGKFRYDLN